MVFECEHTVGLLHFPVAGVSADSQYAKIVCANLKSAEMISIAHLCISVAREHAGDGKSTKTETAPVLSDTPEAEFTSTSRPDRATIVAR